MPSKSKQARIEELDNYNAIFSDMYKDAYGHRPRFSQENWTVDDYKQKIGVLSKIIDDRMQEENKSNLFSFKRKLKDIMVKKECDWKVAMETLMGDKKDVQDFLSLQGLSAEKIEEIQKKYFNY